jgi:hypothetical protein
LKVNKWRIIAMEAPELDVQREVISSLVVSNNQRNAKSMREHSELRRAYLSIDISAKQGQRQFVDYTIGYSATLFSAHLVSGKSNVEPKLSASERSNALRQTRLINWRDSGVRNWMREHSLFQRSGESALEFAYRVHCFIADNFGYGSSGEYAQGCVAANVIQAGQSSCGGISVLFATVMRANSIPSRVRFGRWAVSHPAPGNEGQVHVKSDFFADAVGWINVESVGAIGEKDRPKLDFFGKDSGTFITFHTDTDMEISDLDGRKIQIPFMQFGASWWSGSGDARDWWSKESWSAMDADSGADL